MVGSIDYGGTCELIVGGFYQILMALGMLLI